MDLHLSKPLTLPSGLVLPNRLTKAAMAEAMAENGLPSPAMQKAYGAWADGGWGMVLTGNVQVDERYLGQPGDLVLLDGREEEMLAAWRAWARACKGSSGSESSECPESSGHHRRPAVLVQINHPGRQCPAGAGRRGFFAKSLAPSPVPLRLGEGLVARLASAVVFGTPREMTAADIEDVVRRFAETARISAEAGFDGAEIQYVLFYFYLFSLRPRRPTHAMFSWEKNMLCLLTQDWTVLPMVTCLRSSAVPRRI